MSDFNLDLRSVEDYIEDEEDGESLEGRVVLGVLDGTTDPAEWLQTVLDGNVLVLNVDGDVNELAAGFAREVRDEDGELVHFRGFLIVTPPGVEIDRDRL
ncbi:DUF5779 family protein [Natranaeroarchaeum sulfidigenes]|uniref:Uncharacterized protein n=1 Tax=Natranaeroarchaeum sulfidigenes TaxID=2784880 RepID=A0A897MUZ6_9EURY|nr:DUF5779 family protein [Natranaeroarchaeum sulfidigenes]QSG02065.1 Uncharacterized protein AArcS_0841 [Natranaeroarchaeum sulfidigenes]